jgi:hypothetical protein
MGIEIEKDENRVQSSANVGNRIWHVSFRPQWRIPAAEMLGKQRGEAASEGESSLAPRPEIRRQCTVLCGGGSHASFALKVAKADLLFELVVVRAQCASAAWQYRRAHGSQWSPKGVENQYLVGRLLAPSGHSISSHSSGLLSVSL